MKLHSVLAYSLLIIAVVSVFLVGAMKPVFAHNNKVRLVCWKDWGVSCSVIASHDGKPWGGKLNWSSSGSCKPNSATTTFAVGYGTGTFSTHSKGPCYIYVVAVFNGGHGTATANAKVNVR